MSRSKIDDPQAFASYMDEVDEHLRAKDVPIEGRSIHAWKYVSDDLGIASSLTGSLAKRIQQWYSQRYGSRIRADMTIGRMLVEVRGDAYAVRFPTVYGRRGYNPLELIQGVSGGLFTGMAEADCLAIASTIHEGFLSFQAMRTASLPHDLICDLELGVEQIVGRHTVPGAAKWSFQQAVEKVLNAFVEKHGGDPRAAVKTARKQKLDVHALAPLVKLAEDLGLPSVDRVQLAAAECTADARYPDRVTVSAAEAVRSNHAAVRVCAHVAQHWQPPGWTPPGRPG